VRDDAIPPLSCIDKALQASGSIYRFTSAWHKFPTGVGIGRFSAFARSQGRWGSPRCRFAPAASNAPRSP